MIPPHGAEGPITSIRHRLVRRLRQAALGRLPGICFLEGPRVVAEAAAAGAEIELVAGSGSVPIPTEGVRRLELAPELLARIALTRAPQGPLALARERWTDLPEALALASRAGWPLVVLDGIQDPGNVGTILRTAAALGAPAAAVLPGTGSPYGPRALRSSAGTVFRLALCRATWPELAGLDAIGAAAAGGLPLELARLEGRQLLVLGAEVRGLAGRLLDKVTIPMSDEIDSLNVAAAAAILLYETRRRRS